MAIHSFSVLQERLN